MSTPETFPLFSEFPPEIQRLIFEEAFEASLRKGVHIALVSRAVKSWIEPLIYQCVTLNRHTYTQSERWRFDAFRKTLREGHKSADFYSKYVHKLFIDDLEEHHLAEELLPMCSNLKSLACWIHDKEAGRASLSTLFSPDRLNLPHLQRLSLYWETLPHEYRSFLHPIFQNLTHLDIDLTPSSSWTGLSALENLQFFNLDCISVCSDAHDNSEEVAGELESIVQLVIPHLPPKLRCFIVLVPSPVVGYLASDWLGASPSERQIYSNLVSGQYDQRLVLGSSPEIPRGLLRQGKRVQDLVRHVVPAPYDLSSWAYLPRGHTDFWMEAEAVIHNRMQEARLHSTRAQQEIH